MSTEQQAQKDAMADAPFSFGINGEIMGTTEDGRIVPADLEIAPDDDAQEHLDMLRMGDTHSSDVDPGGNR